MKITNPRRIVHTIALAGGLVGMSATVARAQGEDRFWTGDADQFNSVGMFAEALNWDLDLVSAAPGPDDTAIFDLGNTTIAMFDGAMENNRLLVDGGAVDFELGGFVYTLNNPLEITPSLAIGSETGAVGHLWVGDGVLAAQYADVGAAPGSFGDLTLGAGAALDCAQHLRVGNQGAGLLTIEDGAVATSSRTLIGQTGGAFGDGLISGPGARLDTFGSLIVGGGGMGRLRVDNGAVATADDAIVAQLLNSTGDVVVSGVGSQWTVGGSLDIGFHGFGSLTIEAGAQVTNEVFATLGTMPDIDFSVGDRFEGGRGTVVIDGRRLAVDRQRRSLGRAQSIRLSHAVRPAGRWTYRGTCSGARNVTISAHAAHDPTRLRRRLPHARHRRGHDHRRFLRGHGISPLTSS